MCRFEHVEGRTEWARGTHAHGADEPPERCDAPLRLAVVDVRGGDERHVSRVLTLCDTASKSAAFPRTGLVRRRRVFESNPALRA